MAAAIAAWVVASTVGGGKDGPPQTDAAKLAPETTLVFVDVSTDRDRSAVGKAADLLDRFSSFDAQRDDLLRRLSGGEQPVDVEDDVAPWLGDEAALAFTESGGATAGSLILIEVSDEDKARDFLARNPNKPARNEYKDEPIDSYGTVAVAFKDGWMLVGQDQTVQAALDRANGRGRTLAEDPVYARATRDLPDERVVTAYSSADGLRRLLIPQASYVGLLGSVLDQRGLEGVAMALEATDDGARAVVRTALGADAAPSQTFAPQLLKEVPPDAVAYLGARGLTSPIAALIGQAAGDTAQLIERLRSELRGEVALTLLPTAQGPLLVILARPEDPDRARRTLRELARRVREQNGPQIRFGLYDGLLVVSTSDDAIRRVRDAKGSLEDDERFEDVLSRRPERVGSIGFLDFSQLLELGEQTGLNDSRAYLAAREDLQKIRAVGVSSSGGEEETTAEILLSIP